jgi:hypothetical protein
MFTNIRPYVASATAAIVSLSAVASYLFKENFSDEDLCSTHVSWRDGAGSPLTEVYEDGKETRGSESEVDGADEEATTTTPKQDNGLISPQWGWYCTCETPPHTEVYSRQG